MPEEKIIPVRNEIIIVPVKKLKKRFSYLFQLEDT
jgi:hypothetical protein